MTRVSEPDSIREHPSEPRTSARGATKCHWTICYWLFAIACWLLAIGYPNAD